MKKIYTLLTAIAFMAFTGITSAQVLIDTNFSDMDPVPLNGTNNLNGESVALTNGTIFWHGSRYNDTGNVPFIGEVGGDKVEDGGDAVAFDPAADPEVRYIRTGSNPTITEGKPTNHYFQVTPNGAFVDGGKVTLVISAHGTAKGINVYDATDGVLLGTIDISAIVKYKKETVEFILPETFSGVKTLAFTRADVDGALAGVTFYTWNIKIETNDTSNSIKEEATKSTIFSANKTITIVDSFGKNIEIHSLTGAKIYGQIASSSDVVVSVPEGLYIVVVNNVATKVIVK